MLEDNIKVDQRISYWRSELDLCSLDCYEYDTCEIHKFRKFFEKQRCN
jgi:hypothetical protein